MTSPGGREVGRISIRVVPNTSRFRTDLRRFINQVEHTSRVRIPVDIDDSKIANSLRRLDTNVKKSMGDGVAIKAHPELRDGFREELQAKVATASAGIGISIPVDLDEEGIKNFNHALGRTNDRIVNVNRSGGLLRRVVRGFTGLFSSAGSMLGKFVGHAAEAGAGLTGAASAFAKFGGVAGKAVGVLALVSAGVGILSGAVGLLASVVLLAAGALGTLVAAAPTLISALGPPIAAIAVGMDGIKKAAEVLAPAFDRMKKSVSAAFEQGLTPAFQQLNTIMPMLTTHLEGVARTLSGIAQEAASFITSAEGIRIINDIFAGFDIVLGRAKNGMGELARQILITAGHAPTLRVLGDILHNMSSGIAGFIARARESGDLTATFAALRDILASAGRWLESLVIAGMEFIQGAGPGLTAFFENVKNAFSQVDFRALGTAFGGMLAALANVDPAMVAAFFSSIEKLFNSIRDFANSGVIDVLLGLFSALTWAFSEMIDEVTALFTPVKKLFDLFGWLTGRSTETASSVNAATGSIRDGAVNHSQQAAAGFENNMGRIPPAAGAAGNGAVNQFGSGIQPLPGVASDAGTRATGGLGQGLAPMPGVAKQAGRDTSNIMDSSLGPMPGKAEGIANDTSSRIGDALKSAKPIAQSVGRSIVSAMVNALSGGTASVINTAVNMAVSAFNAAKAALGSHSPSKKFMELGNDTVAGFVIGIRERISSIINVMRDIASRAQAAGGWQSLGRNMAQEIATGLNTSLPDMVRLGTVSDKVWDQLLASGWKGDPTDQMEALYRPQNSAQDLYSAVFDALNGASLHVDGRGVAKLVNSQNLRDQIR